ncbi:hypothetical protein [Bifidobacterium sp. ESL0745]|uniref:hypothetical protein n=1 Tax=Bifidobacterium sp. ESL0745 TaxID=2983226 RepID=UPI0023F78993|nr:hypothetical protein [Bifidobacterium sp. ESL0745]MDF7664885.1 hypothetical protein [Bifidobacterium sp. ESL0745]
MKNSTIQRVAASVLCAVIALAGLSACGSNSGSADGSSASPDGQRTEPESSSNSDNKQKNESETAKSQTFSQMFNGKQTIWFYSSESAYIGKDFHPDAIFVFEHGKVTTYKNWQDRASGTAFTFGDFKGVSEDQLLTKVKELSKGSFDKATHGAKGQYIEPKPYDVTFNVRTDSSGNAVASELINIKYWSQSKNKEDEIRLELEQNGTTYSGSEIKSRTIYDKQFTGFTGDGRFFFGRMSTAGSPEPTMPTFDSIGTAGITEEKGMPLNVSGEIIERM